MFSSARTLQRSRRKGVAEGELLRRISIFQTKIDERRYTDKTTIQVTFSAMYWMAKENIANRKIVRLLDLCQKPGAHDEVFPA